MGRDGFAGGGQLVYLLVVEESLGESLRGETRTHAGGRTPAALSGGDAWRCGGRSDDGTGGIVTRQYYIRLAGRWRLVDPNAHVILVAREQEQRGRGCREVAGCSM